MKIVNYIGLAAALCASVEIPVRAETHTVVLSGVDLRPNTIDAAEKLMARIEEAALEVCGAPTGTSQLLRRAVRRSDCWAASVADAVARIDHPKLTALYRAQG